MFGEFFKRPGAQKVLLASGFIVAIVSAVYIGARAEGAYIRMSCDRDATVTRIGGADYYCLTREQVLAIIIRAKQRDA